MSEPLLVSREDGVLTLTLNRPEALNAFNVAMIGLFHRHVEEAAGDPDVRCVVVAASGRAFCTGGDVKGMAARNDSATPPTIEERIAQMHRSVMVSRML